MYAQVAGFILVADMWLPCLFYGEKAGSFLPWLIARLFVRSRPELPCPMPPGWAPGAALRSPAEQIVLYNSQAHLRLA